MAIVSGGQTGVDRAALDFALSRGLAHGGWCPRGRLAEDGPLDDRYQLAETPSRRYAQRTRWNIRDSDATVVFTSRPHTSGGTALTLALAADMGKPCLHLIGDALTDDCDQAARLLVDFLAQHRVARLNVAGPRASQDPLVASFVEQVLTAAFDPHSDDE